MQQKIDANPDDDEQAPDVETMTVGTVAEAKKAEQQEKAAKAEQAKANQDKPQKKGDDDKKKKSN